MSRLAYLTALAVVALGSSAERVSAQTQNYFGTSGTLNGNVWSTNPGGPYTSALNTTGGAIINFGNTTTSVTGATITVAGINATANVSSWTAGGTITNFNNGVIPIDVASGITLNFGTQAFAASTTAGYIKTGSGVLSLFGGGYGGGFTLNSGTVVIRGQNALGNTLTNTLTLNGGILAATGSFDLSAAFGGGITIGGDVQFGAATGLASGGANLTFSDSVSLGNSLRTLTLGTTSGSTLFSGVISNTGSGGVTFTATASVTGGSFQITNTSTATPNTFTGPITIAGGEVKFSAANSFGDVNNTITVDGGKLTFANTSADTLATTHNIFLGNTTGTVLSTTGATLTYNGAIADKSGVSGTLTKQGAGILSLGGANTYTGSTNINQGTLQLTTSTNRLPTGTTVSLGQASSANLGTFNLNGRNQQIAGLNSISGTNATTNDNTVTSATAATLTLGGSGTYSYGANTNANSGIITGSITLMKSGSGTQTFGDANTYTGTTTISGGTLQFAKQVALYNNVTSNWTATNIVVGTGATLALNVGGTGEFTSANIGTLAALGTATGGFKNGSILGLDTTSANFSYANNLIDTNGGANALGLTVLGTKTLTLTGTNTYTGGTTIASTATLQLGNAGTSGSIVGDVSITSTGTLTFNRSDAVTFAGVVSGSSGNLTQAGAGTLTLTGNNTYGGLTTINSGRTLQIGNGGTSGVVAGDITNNGTLIFNRSDTITYSGVISGSGNPQVTQAGTGTLNFTNANNTSAGSLSITAGTVGGTGTLPGSNTLVSPAAAIRGGIADGSNNTGTLNFAGILTLNGDSILRVEALRTGTGTADASLLNGAAGSQLKLNPGVGDKFIIDVINSGNSLGSETYTIKLAHAPGGFSINGSSISVTGNAGDSVAGVFNAQTGVIDPSQFAMSQGGYTNVTLFLDSGTSQDLLLTFTPTPEPGAILAIAVGALAVGGLIRRRLRNPAQ